MDTSIDQWIQYTHLEKLYGYLPGMTESLPAVFGLTAEQYEKTRATFADRARGTARALLSDPAFADRVAALPFRPGQTVLAVGDSITDDLQSWAEILRHLLGERITVVNGGLSAHTTAMVLRRWPATLRSQPDWIICGLGGNDVTRVGPEPTKPQVTLAESVANLRELHRIAVARTTASWVWLTPVPVMEDRVARYPAFQFGESTWRNADITALAAAIREFPEPVIDLTRVFGESARAALQGPDGVHASLDGQQAIVAALVELLTEH